MILITGGGGFLGLNLARELIDRGEKVALADRRAFEPPSFLTPYIGKQAMVCIGDITEPQFLYSIIREHSIRSIIHCAFALKGSAPLYRTLVGNVDGTLELLEAARIFGLDRVTYLSSQNVYLTTGPMPAIFSEDNDLPSASSNNDLNIGANKKVGEQICQLYASEYKMSVPIVRPSFIWGPMYLHLTGIQTQVAMVRNAVAGKITDLSGVCGTIKSLYVYVRDCAKAIGLVHLAPTLKFPIYNICDGQRHTINDFAQAIREIIPSAQIIPGKTRSEMDVDYPEMSLERIKGDVGFVPEYDLKRGVLAYITWLRDEIYC